MGLPIMFEQKRYEKRGWKYGSLFDYQLYLHHLCKMIMKEIDFSKTTEEKKIWRSELEKLVELRDSVEDKRMEIQRNEKNNK